VTTNRSLPPVSPTEEKEKPKIPLRPVTENAVPVVFVT
jgi:hypothetical protein